jgi:fructose-1,6-bisphosphatase I
MNGGIFMYPKDIVKNKSKIRLLYEAKPLAKIIEEMGGICVDEEIHIHKKKIKDIHETTPIYFGSNENMVDFIEFCRKN